jgi:WD40 repeat protein
MSGGVRLYHLKDGSFRDLPAHAGQSIAYAFSPDNRWIVTGGVDGILHIVELATGKALAPIDTRTRGIVAVTYSPDQQRVVTGTVDGLIQFWDSTLWRNVGTLRGHQKLVSSLVFRDPSTLVSVGLDQVRIWKTTGGIPSPPPTPDRTVL